MRVALALPVLALVGLLAPMHPARAEEEKPCRQQIEGLCPGTQPNTPERRACLQKNVEKLSESCQKMVGHVQGGATPPAAGLQGLVQACQKDHPRMVELCQTGKPPGTSPMPCLVEHAGEFSESCRNWIVEADKLQRAKPGAAPSPGAKAPAGAKPPAAN